MKTIETLALILLVLAATACSGGGSKSDSGDPAPPAASMVSPTFRGTVSVSTAGGDSIRLDWRDAVDDLTAVGDIRYQIFLSATPMGHDFNAPVLTTPGGANSAIVDASHSPLVQPGAPIFAIVRALDHEGNMDDNMVETFVQVAPLAQVAYVERLVGTATEVALGVLGDVSQPFYTIQDAVDAVEAAGGGIVLVHGEDQPSGALWDDEVDLTDPTAGMVEVFGGFPRFSALPTGTVGGALLALRDPARYLTLVTASALTDDDVVLVDNIDVPTVIDGFVFVGSEESAVHGDRAVLQVSGCGFVDSGKAVFGARSGVAVITEGLVGPGSEFRLIGSTFDYRLQTASSDDAAWTGGLVGHLRVQNCDFYGVDSPVTTRDRNGTWLRIPETTSVAIWMTHNRVVGASDPIEFELHAADPAYASHYLLRFERNEMNDLYSSAFRADAIGDVGIDGTATLAFRENLIVGLSGDGFEIDMSDASASSGVIIDLEIARNSILNSNSSSIDLAYVVRADGSTRIRINENVFGASESEAIDLYDASVPADSADQAFLIFEANGNVCTGGSEGLYLEFKVAPDGTSEIDIVGNSVLSSYDYGLYVDLNGYMGLGTGSYPTPNGLFSLNIVGNDIRGSSDEPFYFEDSRSGDDSLAVGLISDNVFGFSGDPGYAAGMYGEFYGPNGAWLIQRNFMGSGGQDSEPALAIYAPRSSTPTGIRLENNVFALAHGPGLEVETFGPRSQIVNNTIAFNGEDGELGVEANDDRSQLLIQNCIVSHSGGADIDPDQLESCFSLVRDAMPIMGYANATGEPNYLLGGAQFLQFPTDPMSVIGSVLALAPASTCIDAGDPDPFMSDTDGSRCDMGAYGGPGAGAIGPVSGLVKTPLVFVGTTPNVDLYSGATLLDTTAELGLAFSRPIDTLTTSAISITVNGSAVPGSFSYDQSERLVFFQPTTGFAQGGTNIVRVDIGAGLAAADGQTLRYPRSFIFAVRPATPLVSIEPNSVDDSNIDAADMAAAQILGFGPGPGGFALTGELYDPLDIDVYGIQLDPGDRIMATVLEGMSVTPEGPGSADVVVDLYRADGTLVHGGYPNMFDRGPGVSHECYLDYTVDIGGAYFLVVRDSGSSAAMQAYELQAVIR